MVELTRDGFLLYPNLPQQGLPASPSSIRPTPIKQLYLRVSMVALPQEHTRIHLSFAYKPKTARINFWLMWITCLAWVYLTGFTPAKLVLVGILFVVTLPAFLFEHRLVGGSQETRLELLNYMQHLVGPALLGENREENMPYRHEHALPF